MKNRAYVLGLVLAASLPLMGFDCDCDGDCEEASVDPTDGYYDRFEGTGLDNACATDADCVVGGCSGEVCAAEPGITTCEALPYGPGGTCGCLNGSCVWNTDTCGECTTDSDCRLYSNYCDGCACDALPVADPDPTCSGTIVACFADPCGFGQTARCDAGTCVVATATAL